MNLDIDLVHAVNTGKLTEKEAAAKQAERDAATKKPAAKVAAAKGKEKATK